MNWMAVNSPPVLQPSPDIAIPTNPVWRLTVEQYHQMIQNGILTDDDPVELLDGWLITKMPKNPPLRATTRQTHEILTRLLPSDWYVDSQEPITIPDSEPEPDVVVACGKSNQYTDRHPGPSEVALVIEVADATLRRDRTLKKRLYARAGIPIYWIINLPESHIEVYTRPTANIEPATYQQRDDYALDAEIPVVVDGNEVGHLFVHEVFP